MLDIHVNSSENINNTENTVINEGTNIEVVKTSDIHVNFSENINNTENTIIDKGARIEIMKIEKYFKLSDSESHDQSDTYSYRYLLFKKSYYENYKENATHLHLCIHLVRKYPELLSYISEFVKSNPESVNGMDNKKWTPIHCCSALSNFYPIYSNTLDILLRGSPNLFLQDREGFTPLHLLMFAFKDENSINSLNLLLASGANVNMQSHQGNTPLHILINSYAPYHTSAFDKAKCEGIRILINAGTNLYLKCEDGNNILHLLAMRDKIPTIEKILYELINNGTIFYGEFVNPNRKNKLGCTPNDYLGDKLKEYVNQKMYKDAFATKNNIFSYNTFSKL